MTPAQRDQTARLFAVLARGDLTESLIASQVVLECLGEQILIRLNRGLDNQGIGFARQRCVLLHQEQGHFAFGQARSGQVQELAGSYLLLVKDIVAEMAEVFDVLDEDAGEYTEGLVAALPSWLLPPESNATELTGPVS